MDEYDSEEFSESYSEIIAACNTLFDKKIDSLMIAAVCTTIGLSLYKSLLDDTDFDKVVEAMKEFEADWESQDNSDFTPLGSYKGYLN